MKYANNKIRTLKVSEYRDCKIYVRNFGQTFEYLAIINNEIYSSNVVATKNPLQKLLGQDYTPKQLANCVSYILKIAETTIDIVLDGSKKMRAEAKKE